MTIERLRSYLQSAKADAEDLEMSEQDGLERARDSGVARWERSSFPSEYIDEIRIYFEYGPHLADIVGSTDVANVSFDPRTFPPALEGRFLSNVLISYDVKRRLDAELPSERELRRFEDLVEGIDEAYDRFEYELPGEFRTDDEFITVSSITRTQLKELGEFEYLELDMWGNEIFPPVVTDGGTYVAHRFHDRNPLAVETEFPDVFVVTKYGEDATVRYNPSFSYYERKPPVGDIEGVHVTVDGEPADVDRLAELNRRLGDRYAAVKRALDRMDDAAVESYFLEWHLRPLCDLYGGIPDEIRASVRTRRYSGLYDHHDIYEYYAAVRDGAQFLLDAVEETNT